MELKRKLDGDIVEVISYGKIKRGLRWLDSITYIDKHNKRVTQICECINDYFEPYDEESNQMFYQDVLSKIREKVDKILDILLKHTDPEELEKENCNDFLMNIIANLVAKRLEKILKI